MVEHHIRDMDYTTYQDWFRTRKVGVVNHGVPDFKDEIEGLVDDIERVPWESLTDEEKVATANIAMDACCDTVIVCIRTDKVDVGNGIRVCFHIASLLFNMVTGTEDPMEGQGLSLALIKQDYLDQDEE